MRQYEYGCLSRTPFSSTQYNSKSVCNKDIATYKYGCIQLESKKQHNDLLVLEVYCYLSAIQFTHRLSLFSLRTLFTFVDMTLITALRVTGYSTLPCLKPLSPQTTLCFLHLFIYIYICTVQSIELYAHKCVSRFIHCMELYSHYQSQL